jgi:hypothetical protein
MFEFEYRLTTADLAAHQRRTVQRLARRSPQDWRPSKLAGFVAVFGAAALLTFAAAELFPHVGLGDFELASAYFGFLLGVLLVFAATWQNAFAMRATMFEPDGPSLSAQTASIDGTGLRFTASRFRTAFDWNAILDVTDVGDAVTLWVDGGQGILIPHRAFASPETRAEFVAFVRKYQGRSGPPPHAV